MVLCLSVCGKGGGSGFVFVCGSSGGIVFFFCGNSVGSGFVSVLTVGEVVLCLW